MVFDFESGHLALDFANTVNWHASQEPHESIHTYHDLLEWGRQAGLLTESQVKQLDRSSPRSSAEALKRARGLREAIYRVFRDLSRGESPQPADLESLSDWYQAAVAHAHLVPAGDRYGWAWEKSDAAPDRVLWPVARAAVELLFSPDELERVGQCEDDRGCGWLFIDTSRNRSRRWCSMESCGNRAKARRYYRRSQAGD